MELAMMIYLLFGISFCIAAPLQNEDSLSKCLNHSELSSVQRDIFKNCHDFKKLNHTKNFYSADAKNNTLCILYYNSLSAYCQLNSKSAKYPHLKDIQSNDLGPICKQITPNLETISKEYNTITCYSLCSQFIGEIRPECLYAYYYNKSSNLNMPDTELPINGAINSRIGNNITITQGNMSKESSNTTASSETSSGPHVVGQENTPPIVFPKKSNLTTVNKDDPMVDLNNPLINNISPDITTTKKIPDPKDLIHDSPSNAEEKDEKVEGNPEEPPPKPQQSPGIEEHQPVNSPINNNENEEVNQVEDKGISDSILENPSNNVNNDESEYNIDNINAGDRTQQQDDANNGFEESVDTAAKLEEEKEIFDQREEKKPDFVQDNPVDSENIDDIDGESYFFSYFMVICVLCILGYVGYHNRIKVMALLLEGKRGKRQHRGRRPNSANYHKLDTNLEEAISSNVTKNSNNVIF